MQVRINPIGDDSCAHDGLAIVQAHSTNSASGTAHDAHIAEVKPYCLARAADQHQMVLFLDGECPDQCIAFDDILDVAPPRGHGALWNPICLDPVHLTAGGEHHQTVMTVALAHDSSTVVIGNFHGLLSAGSTVLPPKGVHRHSLDVATPSHRNQDVLAGDHVFSCDLADANANLCQAVMSISLGNGAEFVADARTDAFRTVDDRCQFRYLGAYIRMLRTNGIELHACQLLQPQVEHCLCLSVVDRQKFNELLPRL